MTDIARIAGVHIEPGQTQQQFLKDSEPGRFSDRVYDLRAEEIDRCQRELALLRSVMAAVNSSLDLDEVLSLALRSVLEVMRPGLWGMVLLLDRYHQELVVAAQQGLPAVEGLCQVHVGECLCGRVAQTGTPIFATECPGNGCPARFLKAQRHDRLVFPLKVRQEVVGVFCVSCPPGFRTGPLDLSLWEDVGAQIGMAVENANLYDQVQQERDFLETLYNVSAHLATSLDLDWVLSQVLRLAISATDARDGSIFLLSTTGASAPRILRRDLSASEADEAISRVLAQGVAGWVVRHKLGTIVSDTSQDPTWLSFTDDPNPPGSALAVPLLADGRVLGVLTLDHPETDHFQNRHLDIILAIARQASAEIEKARLYNQVSHLAEALEQRVEERTRELRETQAYLIQAEKLAALGELAAGVAHEINNPLHFLQTYVEYMGTQAAPGDPILEFLDSIRDSLTSIAHLAGQLRDFSRPAGGEWKPVNVNDSVANVLRLVNKELMHSHVTVERSLSPDLPVVLGDARQLEQVFLNLILNARDAMPGGGRLTIETCANGDKIMICFSDTGVGIVDENLPRIFEPYFTTKEDRGTGLGLAICQRIVTQHGGEIDVSSKVGQGTVFAVHLPIKPLDWRQLGQRPIGPGSTMWPVVHLDSQQLRK